jgi:hypothetical protein
VAEDAQLATTGYKQQWVFLASKADAVHAHMASPVQWTRAGLTTIQCMPLGNAGGMETETHSHK